MLGEFLYPFRERQVVLILAPVGGEPVHLCGICGFALEEPGQDCPRCAMSQLSWRTLPGNERDGAIIQDRQEVVAGVEAWLVGQRSEPHPLEVELVRLQAALKGCPPLWWPERLR